MLRHYECSLALFFPPMGRPNGWALGNGTQKGPSHLTQLQLYGKLTPQIMPCEQKSLNASEVQFKKIKIDTKIQEGGGREKKYHDPCKTQERSPVKIQQRDSGWQTHSATFLSIWKMLAFLLPSVNYNGHKSEKQASSLMLEPELWPVCAG